MSLSYPSQSANAQSFWPPKMPDGICWTSPHKHLWCLRGGSRPNAVIVEVTSVQDIQTYLPTTPRTLHACKVLELQLAHQLTCTSVDSTDYPFIVTFTNPPEVSFQMFLLMTPSNHRKFANTNHFDLQKHVSYSFVEQTNFASKFISFAIFKPEFHHGYSRAWTPDTTGPTALRLSAMYWDHCYTQGGGVASVRNLYPWCCHVVCRVFIVNASPFHFEAVDRWKGRSRPVRGTGLDPS